MKKSAFLTSKCAGKNVTRCFSSTRLVNSPVHVYSWGYGGLGRLGHGTSKNEKAPRPVAALQGINIKQISAGGSHTMALDDQGNVFAWGRNTEGQLGVGHFDSYLSPGNVPLKDVETISAGDYNSAAISKNGDVFTWGYNGAWLRGIGGLGYSGKGNVNTPKQVKSDSKIDQVSMGLQHSLSRTNTGRVYSCGKGEWGRLGVGSNADHPESTKVPLYKAMDVTNINLAGDDSMMANAVDVGAGSLHSAIVTDEGELYTFGKNEHFQLGIDSSGNYIGGNNFDSQNVPQLVAYLKEQKHFVTQVSCGETMTAVVTKEGRGFWWGMRVNYLPKLIAGAGDANFVQVSCGANHAGFLTDDGRLFMIGKNYYRQLGVEKDKYKGPHTAVEVQIVKDKPAKVLSVSCGNQFTIALVEHE